MILVEIDFLRGINFIFNSEISLCKTLAGKNIRIVNLGFTNKSVTLLQLL